MRKTTIQETVKLLKAIILRYQEEQVVPIYSRQWRSKDQAITWGANTIGKQWLVPELFSHLYWLWPEIQTVARNPRLLKRIFWVRQLNQKSTQIFLLKQMLKLNRSSNKQLLKLLQLTRQEVIVKQTRLNRSFQETNSSQAETLLPKTFTRQMMGKSVLTMLPQIKLRVILRRVWVLSIVQLLMSTSNSLKNKDRCSNSFLRTN